MTHPAVLFLNVVQKQIERDSHRMQELGDRRAQLDAEVSEQTKQGQRLAENQQAIAARLDSAQQHQRSLQHDINDQRSQLEDEKNGLIDLMQRTTGLHNEIKSLDRFEQTLVSSRQKIDQRAEHVSGQLHQLGPRGRVDVDCKHGPQRYGAVDLDQSAAVPAR